MSTGAGHAYAQGVSRGEQSPNPREAAISLELVEQIFDRFQTDVLLSYGGIRPPSN